MISNFIRSTILFSTYRHDRLVHRSLFDFVQDVPRTKRAHWSSAEPFGSWPAYDRYDEIKEVISQLLSFI